MAGEIAIASNPGRALAVCTAARRVQGAPGNVDAQTPSAGLGSAASVVVVGVASRLPPPRSGCQVSVVAGPGFPLTSANLTTSGSEPLLKIT